MHLYRLCYHVHIPVWEGPITRGTSFTKTKLHRKRSTQVLEVLGAFIIICIQGSTQDLVKVGYDLALKVTSGVPDYYWLVNTPSTSCCLKPLWIDGDHWSLLKLYDHIPLHHVYFTVDVWKLSIENCISFLNRNIVIYAIVWSAIYTCHRSLWLSL